MSFRSLQHLVLRMHLDPALVRAVYEGGQVPGLSAQERAWLRQVDRRAFSTDPHRPARILHALVEEYPVTASAVAPEMWFSFFASSHFVAVVEDRGRLWAAFGAWLRERVGPVAELERAVARLRRGFGRERVPLAAPEESLIRAPHVMSLALPAATLSWHAAVTERLGPDPVAALFSGVGRDLPRPPLRRASVAGAGRSRRRATTRDGAGEEYVLLCRTEAGTVALSRSSEGLHGLLMGCTQPVSREGLHAIARTHGADAGEDEEIVADLLREGFIVTVPRFEATRIAEAAAADAAVETPRSYPSEDRGQNS